MAAEIAATVVEDRATFRALRAPLERVCAAPVPVPFSPPMEDFVLPNRERIIEAVRRALSA
jgi:pyruvate dehydrogenase E1 component beta subunit